MNLTKFIKQPDVRARFRQEFVKPRFILDNPLLAPVITSNPQKIGTAFDYLLRFYANYLNPNALSRQWVAETSLEILDRYKDEDTVIINSKFRIGKARNVDQLSAGYIEECKELKNKSYSEAKKNIAEAKKNLSTYLNSGKINDSLIASALSLAKLDELHRASYLPPLERSISEKNDIEDLRQLFSIINPKTFKAKHTCVLNPVFGPEASQLLRADGDLVLDDMLIEIKTVKNFKVDRSNFDQLLGYYTMYRIGGIRAMSPSNHITKLGIYFSRHGYLHTYKIDDIVDETTYLDFIEWFKKRAVEPASK